ncbi:MAG: D-alanyl-D-alanine carboxypeptidase [Clostridiales bacterium]|nr:D-alanyl-D-alanine carboxypeptidase [Clostridiales bacterium]
MMLQSANDAAAAIAYEIAGGISEFAEMMNAKARELGLENTHFSNPHGLDDTDHYTTARDLAALARYALENETFARIVSTKKITIKMHGGDTSRVLVNHNRLLRTYDDIIGVKTGYTKKCGRTLVSAAERDGVRLICVTLDDGDDWRDHRAMLDAGFDKYERV